MSLLQMSGLKSYLTSHIHEVPAKLKIGPTGPTDELYEDHLNVNPVPPSSDTGLVDLTHENSITAQSQSAQSQKSTRLGDERVREERSRPSKPKKSFPCDKCASVFVTAVKLNDHKYNLHGNSSSSEDLFTPIKNSQKNKARKMANKQTKIKVENVDVMESSELEQADQDQGGECGCY